MGCPFSTNGFSVFNPTYRLDGCTSKVEFADHCCRFTSVTDAFADTLIGTGGFALTKSKCKTCAPVASVLAVWLHVLGATYASSRDVLLGCQP
jgi:hypothetical protein